MQLPHTFMHVVRSETDLLSSTKNLSASTLHLLMTLTMVVSLGCPSQRCFTSLTKRSSFSLRSPSVLSRQVVWNLVVDVWLAVVDLVSIRKWMMVVRQREHGDRRFQDRFPCGSRLLCLGPKELRGRTLALIPIVMSMVTCRQFVGGFRDQKMTVAPPGGGRRRNSI